MSKALISEWRSRAERPFPDQGMSGRGIVTCAGGARLFTCAYVLVRLLRETLACALPIQVWHFGGEELSPVMRHLLLRYDVELVDATAVLEQFPADIRDGWALKAYAIAYSRFEEVLFLDADQAPVRDPSFLFDSAEYGRSGALFWPDIIDLKGDNPIWACVGLVGETCRSWESGQLVVDKRRHWGPLQIALLLNERADLIYGMLYGDKDTFLIAWRLAGAQAEVAPHRPFNDPRVLVQRDFEGEPLFQHRTNSKWNYHATQYEVPGLVHMEACHGFLEDLRSAWNGRLFFPPDRSLRARAEEVRLQGTAGLRLTMLGDQQIELELLEGCQIGRGRSVDRQNWYVIETGDGLELILHDGDKVSYRLRSILAGSWEGSRVVDPANDARLDEGRAGACPTHADGARGLLQAVLDAGGFYAASTPGARAELLAALRLLLRAEPALQGALETLGRQSDALRDLTRELLQDLPSQRLKALDKGSALERMTEGYVWPGASD